MFGYTEDMIIVLYQDGRIIRINDPLLSFLKQSRTEILGNLFGD